MYTLHQLISVCKHEAGVSATQDPQLCVRKDSLSSFTHTRQITSLVTVESPRKAVPRRGKLQQDADDQTAARYLQLLFRLY